jgi:cytochrome c-type biogenesis protein CcmH/NrfG
MLRQANPHDASSVFEAAMAVLKAGDDEEEALSLVQHSLRHHPGEARLWQALGLLYRGLEDMAPAAEAFARAAALAPAEPLIAHSLARVRMEAGVAAAELFERAHRLAPQDGSVLIGRAAALFAEQRTAEAISGLDEQLRLHPGWIEGHQTICRLRWIDGEGDTYTRSFEEALSRNPADTAVWREYAETLMHAGTYDAALEILARARKVAGNALAFDASEAVAVAEKGHDIGLADQLFVRLGPIQHVTMAVRQVRHLFRTGRLEQGLAMAEQWAPRDPDLFLCPYLAAGWRLTGDPRWQWLEGDPRLVGVYDLSRQLPSLEALAERLRSLHLATHQPLEQSVRGGTQTDGTLLSRIEPEIRTLRTAIVDAVRAHLDQLPPTDKAHPHLCHRRDRKIRFSGSWSVRLTGGGRHANHVHPAGWFSSAFYVTLPPKDQSEAGTAGWLTLGEPQEEMGLTLEPFRLVEPKPGQLVLFPSTMWHGTRPFAAGERMTVAFDVARPS